MAEAQTPSKKGLTRGKAILIGILSVVLVAILYIQFGHGGEKPSGEAIGYRPPRPALAVQPVPAVQMSGRTMNCAMRCAVATRKQAPSNLPSGCGTAAVRPTVTARAMCSICPWGARPKRK